MAAVKTSGGWPDLIKNELGKKEKMNNAFETFIRVPADDSSFAL